MINGKNMDEKGIKAMENIIDNYIQNEKTIVNQLYFSVSNHGTTIGGFREEIWKGMFEQIIPKKFVIERSVFIIDSNGNVSKEVDLAIIDEMYTPYIFRYRELKFLPIEAVAVVVECKSQRLKEGTLKEWGKSIVALKTSLKSYTRIIDRIACGEDIFEKTETTRSVTQTATRPLRILCCMDEANIDEELFDIVIKAPKEEGNLEIVLDEKKGSLQEWYKELNHVNYEEQKFSVTIDKGKKVENIKLEDYEIRKGENIVSLLTLNLQLNQILMMINNPILFPHKAYAKMFQEVSKKGFQEVSKKEGTRR